MKIVHIGRFRLGTVNGSYNALWDLAKAQAEEGHRVSIIRVGKNPDPGHVAIAKENGIKLLGFPCPTLAGFWKDESQLFERLISELQPDIAHLQYVRIPKYFYISRLLWNKGIPFVISLHGGLNPVEMGRKRWRKLLYWFLIERPVHNLAAAIHFITNKEKEDYYRTLGHPRPGDFVIFNPVSIPPGVAKWQGKGKFNKVRIAYFGRYDIWHKGLDLAVKMVRALRREGVKAELHLFGSAGDRFVSEMSALVADNSDVPIIDHGFIGGDQKFSEMAKFDFYLQYSRFELFGLSLVEALGLGIPTLVSENCDLAPYLSENGAAIKIPMDPDKATETVIFALNDPEELKRIGARGKTWVKENCDPATVSRQMIKAYENAIKG